MISIVIFDGDRFLLGPQPSGLRPLSENELKEAISKEYLSN